MVIGDLTHIPKRLAPFARALVSVYEVARYSEREFTEDEYRKYMHLLGALVHRCVVGVRAFAREGGHCHFAA